jgi:hypothetical protein
MIEMAMVQMGITSDFHLARTCSQTVVIKLIHCAYSLSFVISHSPVSQIEPSLKAAIVTITTIRSLLLFKNRAHMHSHNNDNLEHSLFAVLNLVPLLRRALVSGGRGTEARGRSLESTMNEDRQRNG